MNKKAFVLMETIVVILVISIALLTIFASYSKILTKLKTENKYDTSEYIYMTKYIRDYLKNNACAQTSNEVIYEMGEKSASDTESRKKILKNYFDSCGFTSDHPFNIKGIYLLKYLNEVDEDESNKDLYRFNANMIDYIKKLDVGSTDTILVVEYQRTALNTDGSELKDYVNGLETNTLYETYIASLEW